MAKESKKKGGEEEETGESAPLWIVSFADLVVLLMSFFVIISVGNTRDVKYDAEFAKVIAAIKQAFGYMPNANSTDPIDLQILHGLAKMHKKRGSSDSGQRGDAQQAVAGAVGRHDLVTTIREGTKATIGGRVPFEKDSAEISAEAIPILTDIAKQIRGHTNVFLVKGHTSGDEEYRLRGTDRDLGYERAREAVIRLVAMDVAEEALRVQSCRAYEPLKEGAYSETSRSANRRIEVIATESLISEYRGQRSDLAPRTDKALTGESVKEKK